MFQDLTIATREINAAAASSLVEKENVYLYTEMMALASGEGGARAGGADEL